MFQYILCFGSSLLLSLYLSTTKIVSIHPMFRFKLYPNPCIALQKYVSIHPMFRFKSLPLVSPKKSKNVSIHPMFRFKVVFHLCLDQK